VKPQSLIIAFMLLGVSQLLINANDRVPASERSAHRDWLILPRGASGSAIFAESTEADLIQTYGTDNVRQHNVDLGEGESEKGTELFPADPMRRVDILWKDPIEKRAPQRVQISGSKSLWRTVHSISLGTTLKQLEQWNRKPFRLAGFAFDYSGTVVSWDNGTLAQALDNHGRVILRLQPSLDQSQQSYYRSVLGNASFSSSHPAMQRLNPSVYELIWIFP